MGLLLIGCSTGASDAAGGGAQPTNSGQATGPEQPGTLPNADVSVLPGVVDNSADGSTNPNDAGSPPGTGALPDGASGNGNVAQGAGNTTPALDANFMVDSRYAYSYVGRFDLSDPNAVRFNWPGSRIGIAFTGTSLAVILRDTGYDTFDVQIDGNDYASPADAFGFNASAPLVPCKLAAQVPAWDGNNFPGCILAVPSNSSNLRQRTTYPVVTDLPPGNHVAWITKRSEFLQQTAGTTTFYGVKLDANATLLPPPPYRKRRIEFVGDSSFSGFGSSQRNPCGYSSRNSAANRAIPAYTAKYLKAEYVVPSSSGQGVYQSFYDHDTSHNLPVLYRQTVALDATAAKAWDFSDVVDAVIFSAGGDDLWGPAGSGTFENNNPNLTTSATDNFVAAYVAWLAEVRAKRPNAVLIVTLTYGAAGADVVSLGGALQRAVAQRNDADDAKVVYYTYFPIKETAQGASPYVNVGDIVLHEKLWLGCTGHPSPVFAEYLGARLGAFVAKQVGYTDAGY